MKIKNFVPNNSFSENVAYFNITVNVPPQTKCITTDADGYMVAWYSDDNLSVNLEDEAWLSCEHGLKWSNIGRCDFEGNYIESKVSYNIALSNEQKAFLNSGLDTDKEQAFLLGYKAALQDLSV